MLRCTRPIVGAAAHSSSMHAAAASAALPHCALPLASAASCVAIASPLLLPFFSSRSFSCGRASGLLAPKRSSSNARVTTTTNFSPSPRRSSMDPLGGALADPTSGGPPASGSGQSPGLLTLSSVSRSAMLNPLRVSRGHSAKAARMERDLHAPNASKLNHSLAYYISRTKSWAELVPLLFQHMHHMTAHNYVRACQRLVALSPSRPLLDADLYNQFGRFMVQVEVQLSELEALGLMKLVFVPYHYLKQCLRQMHRAQQAALDHARAHPEETRAERKAQRMTAEAGVEASNETRGIDDKMAAKQSELRERHGHAHARGDDKTKKLRAQERRAGRAFTSVAATMKERSSNKGKSLRKLSGGTKRAKPGKAW